VSLDAITRRFYNALMMRAHFAVTALTLSLVGCGIQKEEHDRLLKQALNAQRAGLIAQMAENRNNAQRQIAEAMHRVDALEKDLQRLGIDVSQTRTGIAGQLDATLAELELVRKQRERTERDAAAFKMLAEKLKSMIDAGKLEVATRKGRMMLKMPSAILFSPGSKRITKDGQETLLFVADVLKTVEDRDFMIAGHTDDVPVKANGGYRSNWDLSTARAIEVLNTMIANGVSAQSLAAAGYGEFDPVSPNDSEEGRAKNRRIEIILMPRLEDLPLIVAAPPAQP
jgi:chemotaxis protein MotB